MSYDTMSPTGLSPLEASQRAEILELESQIRTLNTKISAAVDHAADLSDELRLVKAREKADLEAREAAANETPMRRMSTYLVQAARRSSSITTGISPANSISAPSGRASMRMSISPSDEEMKEKLEREISLRKEAEEKYSKLAAESETLSQSLFEEANKMVAQEKRATFRVEEKLKVHVERENERVNRLKVLEAAVDRITRVRGVLAGVSPVVASGAQQQQQQQQQQRGVMV